MTNDAPVNIDSFEALDIDEMSLREQPAYLNEDDPRIWDRLSMCSPNGQYGSSEYSWCPERAQSREAEKKICWEECPVRKQCLTWGIVQGEKHCIYGGYNHDQRRLIRRRWKAEAVLPLNIERIELDPEDVFRIFAEAANSKLYEMVNPIDFDTMELIDPDPAALKAIEQEDVEGE